MIYDYHAEMILDSISPDGWRIATMEARFPRIVLAEFNTHRRFSRNSASSRAIPAAKMLRMVQESPYIPSAFGINQKGMQAAAAMVGEDAVRSRDAWLTARDAMVKQAEVMMSIGETGVHKELVNRLLEAFTWQTVIVTSTEWNNFFHLRDHQMAHPAIHEVARLMRSRFIESEPRLIQYKGWHLPYVYGKDPEPAPLETCLKLSTARCARVSCLTHAGVRDINEDLRLHDDLLRNCHMSPFEHQARPMDPEELRTFKSSIVTVGQQGGDPTQRQVFRVRDPLFGLGDVYWDQPVISIQKTASCGNVDGWVQYRKVIPGEWDALGEAA